MKRRMWTSRLACAVLVVGVLGGVAFAAGTQGSQDDPLVTLSYLNEKAMPEIMKQVDAKLAEREKALTEKLQEESQSAFSTVELKAGKTLTLSSGSQILLRQGGLTTTAPLLDLTDGTTHNGGELTANHLYLAAGDSQTLTASTAVTAMVQGGWK